ncbi:MAG: PD-(D/E)XK nuclease family protein [Bryobacteraceae bacterium]|nr:PD-(D/E)XK nuclease family protein [Bryobacteraceae bacterium]
MRRIVRGRSYRELLDAASGALGGEALILAPEKGAADEPVWRASGGSLGIYRLTPMQLAAQLAAEALAAHGLAPLTPLGREALVARAVYELRRERRFEYFARIADTPGFVRAAAATLDELRMNAVQPDGDLARLLAKYEELRREAQLADMAELFALAADCGSHRLLGLPAVFLDLPVRDALTERLLARVVRDAPSALALTLEADRESAAALARALPGAVLQDRLGDRELPADLDYFSSPGENFECVEIARRIRDLADRGVPFDRVAILLRHPARYQPLVEEALRRAGIPGYYSLGAVRPDPAGRALLALLECAAERLSASRFAEYLSLAEAPAMQAGWEQLIVDAAVIGGAERWERRLAGLRAEFEAQLTGDIEESYRPSIERRLAQLERLTEFALPVVRELAALPKQATWGAWLTGIAALAKLAVRRPEAILAVLDELHPMAEVGPVSLEEVAAALGERLGALRVEPPARRFGQVFVASIEEARGRHFDAVFLPGLAEGLFPVRVLEDPLLLDGERERYSPALATNATRAARERLLLHIAAAAGARLTTSYPRLDAAQSRPRVPSFYALEVVRAAAGEFPKIEEFQTRAREAAQARLGWPAPAEPSNAIDDAEYDLAVLAAAMNDRSARGRTRYMLDANPALARSTRTRWKRWETKWSGSDGLYAEHRALEAHRLLARPHSATSLQRFAACPYQFLLSAIHRLAPREEPVAIEQLDPLTRGTLFHEVQRRFFANYDADADLDEMIALGDGKLDEVAAEYAEKLAPAIERVWTAEIEDLRTDLRGWLRELSREDRWEPRDAEREIAATVFDAVHLRGRLDLIEFDPVGGVYRVTDHKTGKPPEEKPVHIGRGAFLQPALYAAAAEVTLGAQVATGRLFYCTQRGGYSEIEVKFADATRHYAREALQTVDRAIGEGRLVAAPRRDACGVCEYGIVCGPYEERRTALKPPLPGLTQLRGMP